MTRQRTDTLESSFDSLHFLAEGSRSHIFRARNIYSGRTVAVKFLKGEFRQEKEGRVRFHREMKAYVALDCPNIVRVFSAGEEPDGRRYIEMELVDGVTLTQVLTSRVILADEALSILAGVTNAIAHAHSRGVVHRDLRDANIMYTHDRVVKVLDFGCAKILGDEEIHPVSALQPWSRIEPDEYTPPELLNYAGPFEPERMPPMDVFAIGVLARKLYVADRMAVDEPALSDLLLRAVRHDQAHRPAAADLLAALQAPLARHAPVRRPSRRTAASPLLGRRFSTLTEDPTEETGPPNFGTPERRRLAELTLLVVEATLLDEEWAREARWLRWVDAEATFLARLGKRRDEIVGDWLDQMRLRSVVDENAEWLSAARNRLLEAVTHENDEILRLVRTRFNAAADRFQRPLETEASEGFRRLAERLAEVFARSELPQEIAVHAEEAQRLISAALAPTTAPSPSAPTH